MSQAITHEEHLYSLAVVMTNAVKTMLEEKAELTFSADPEFKLKEVTQFMNRMRIDAMEKFNKPTVFSVITFYSNEKDLKKERNSLGAMVLYLEQYEIDKLLRWLDYPTMDDDEDEDELKDSCGAIANLIGGYFVREIGKLGFAHLQMSHFKSYVNTAVDGVEFPSDQKIKYEVSYHIRKAKRMVVELAVSALPRVEGGYGLMEHQEQN